MPNRKGLKKRREKAAARLEAHKRRREWAAKIKSFFAAADSDGSGELTHEQVGAMVVNICTQEMDGKVLTDGELKSAVGFIFLAADADKGGTIDQEELEPAVTAWVTWTDMALGTKANDLFKEFDTDQTGNLTKEQLTNLLTKLNDGTVPTEAEVETVVKKADKRGNGVIDMEEVTPAIAIWYQIADGGTEEEGDGLVEGSVEVKGSKGCACAIM